MKTILVICPKPTDATSLYRGMGPISRLKEKLPDTNFILVNEVNWVTIGMVDLVFMQRPFTSDHLRIAEITKSNRKPLWVDYDDDLFSVPESNPAYSIYGKEEIKKNVARIIARADVVSVSSAALKESLTKLNQDIRIIPNAFDEKLFSYRGKFKDREDVDLNYRNPLMLWRGTSTHDKDLWGVTRELTELSYRFSKFTFTLMASPFWLTLESMNPKNTMKTDPVDPIEYMEVIHTLRPLGMFCPLHDCKFNRAKSNIAWIEATFAGAITIAPNFEEWRKPGVITYDKPEDFHASMRDVMSLNVDTAAQVDASWKYIEENLFLGKVNDLRVRLIQDFS